MTLWAKVQADSVSGVRTVSTAPLHAALAVCAITCADTRTTTPRTPTSRTEPPPTDIGLIPPTVTEIKRLFNLATRAWRSVEHHLHWSGWRRRHQARARWYHHRARLT